MNVIVNADDYNEIMRQIALALNFVQLGQPNQVMNHLNRAYGMLLFAIQHQPTHW